MHVSTDSPVARQGAASGLCLAGFDIGKIAGPSLAGVTATWIGLETTFVVLAMVMPATAAGGLRAT
jgi:hypothetical protein